MNAPVYAGAPGVDPAIGVPIHVLATHGGDEVPPFVLKLVPGHFDVTHRQQFHQPVIAVPVLLAANPAHIADIRGTEAIDHSWSAPQRRNCHQCTGDVAGQFDVQAALQDEQQGDDKR